MQNLSHPPAASNGKVLFLTNLVPAYLAFAALVAIAIPASAQLSLGSQQSAPTPPPSTSYQGSLTSGPATGDTLQLTLDDAVQRALSQPSQNQEMSIGKDVLVLHA